MRKVVSQRGTESPESSAKKDEKYEMVIDIFLCTRCAIFELVEFIKNYEKIGCYTYWFL